MKQHSLSHLLLQLNQISGLKTEYILKQIAPFLLLQLNQTFAFKQTNKPHK